MSSHLPTPYESPQLHHAPERGEEDIAKTLKEKLSTSDLPKTMGWLDDNYSTTSSTSSTLELSFFKKSFDLIHTCPGAEDEPPADQGPGSQHDGMASGKDEEDLRTNRDSTKTNFVKFLQVAVHHYLNELDIFCDQTQLHGPYRMKGSLPSKTKYGFFTVVFLVSFGFGVNYTLMTYDQFASSTVATNIVSETEPISSIVFPTTVVCNNYKLRQSFLELLIGENYTENVNELAGAIYRNYVSGYNAENEHYEQSDQEVLMEAKLSNRFNMTGKEFTRFVQGRGVQLSGVLEPIHRGEVVPDSLTRCPAIVATEPLRSGEVNGLEFLIDAETFDNADPSAQLDGFHILVKNSYDASLIDLNGFYVAPGTELLLKLQPELYTITDTAKSRFNYQDRKCIYSGEFTVPSYTQKLLNSSEYSHSSCLLAATFDEIKKSCRRADLVTLGNTGRELGCVNELMKEVGQFETVLPLNSDEPVQCTVGCTRQSNSFVRTDRAFPNRQFARKRGFWWVVHQLFKSCNPRPEPVLGYKRSALLRSYPKICDFFDRHIYQNSSLNLVFTLSPSVMLKRLGNATFEDFVLDTLLVEKNEYEDTLRQILVYCKENIIRLTMYLDRPYITKLETDQTYSVAMLLASLGGMWGFALGFSIVCFFEFFYILLISPLFPFIRWLWRERLSRKKTKPGLEEDAKTTPKVSITKLTGETVTILKDIPVVATRQASLGDDNNRDLAMRKKGIIHERKPDQEVVTLKKRSVVFSRPEREE